MFCDGMKTFKARVTLLRISTKDVEQSVITNLGHYDRLLDFDQKVKHLMSQFAKVKSTLVRLESTLDSCPVCKGKNSNLYQQMTRMKSKMIKLEAIQAEVDATIMDLTTTFHLLRSAAAA